MIARAAKAIIRTAGADPERLVKGLSAASLKAAAAVRRWGPLLGRLRAAVPDISGQESSEADTFDGYRELKRRGMHAFQMGLTLRAAGRINKDRITVVDIGDSAGTHMLYLKALLAGKTVDTVSVNLDPRAVAKVKARGLEAVLCRAEDLKLERPVDLFVSFEMLEHLHNPALFLRRLALRPEESLLAVTVPYMRRSRVGLHHVRSGTRRPVHAEEEHVFELSPEDWTLLFRHAGWRVLESETYLQYPRWPGLSAALGWFWRRTDYEGFWGAVLARDRSLSDLYLDWES